MGTVSRRKHLFGIILLMSAPLVFVSGCGNTLIDKIKDDVKAALAQNQMRLLQTLQIDQQGIFGFQDQEARTRSKPVVFTIENSGDADLLLTGDPPVQITGDGATLFEVVSQPEFSTITPGSSTTFTIVFTPSVKGDFSATVKIPSDDPDADPFEFTIHGHALFWGSPTGEAGTTGDPVHENQKFVSTNTGVNVRFGFDIALYSDVAVAGQNEGGYVTSAFLMGKKADRTWFDKKVLDDSGGFYWSDFGRSVDIDGDYAIAGAPGETVVDGTYVWDKGAAYIFYRNEGGPDNWGMQKKLMPADLQEYDQFGISVAISGDYAAVGAYNDFDDVGNPNYGNGAVYIFYRNEGGTNNWGQQNKLTSSVSEDGFGRCIALHGDYGAAGAELDTSQTGAVYVFERTGSVWSLNTDWLVGSNCGNGDEFGHAVAIFGDTILVGTGSRETVYVYDRENGLWGKQVSPLLPLRSENIQISASDGAIGGLFGSAISLYSTIAMIGSPGDNGGAGSAYIFEKTSGGWVQKAKCTAQDSESNEEFGYALDIYNDTILVSSPYDSDNGVESGSVYIFNYD
jgi:hypothetical protein